ncbi:MAG: hypothetical protein IKQ35_00210 [Bacilli bacterium]|nr:hypothetical protein [Bacilli bacterium]
MKKNNKKLFEYKKDLILTIVVTVSLVLLSCAVSFITYSPDCHGGEMCFGTDSEWMEIFVPVQVFALVFLIYRIVKMRDKYFKKSKHLVLSIFIISALLFITPIGATIIVMGAAYGIGFGLISILLLLVSLIKFYIERNKKR